MDNSTFIVSKKLGVKGSTSQVWEIYEKENPEVKYALKKFNPRTSQYNIQQEIEIQILSSQIGCAPMVLQYDIKKKYIVMEKLKTNLYDEIRANYGNIPIEDQYKIYNILKKLDENKIFHKDPNPLNFMKNEEGEMFLVDYGMSEKMSESGSYNRIQGAAGLGSQLRKMFPYCDYSVLLMDVPSELMVLLNLKPMIGEI